MQVHNLTVRQKMIAAAIVLLVILNLWRWWPGSAEQASQQTTQAEDKIYLNEMKLSNFIAQSSTDVGLTRNLFTQVVARKKSIKPVATKAVVNKTVSTGSGKQYVGLNGFKLEGVLDTGGKIQAFLSNKDEVYMVYKGDKFAAHFFAERVSLDGILLRDNSKGVTKWIGLSGE